MNGWKQVPIPKRDPALAVPKPCPPPARPATHPPALPPLPLWPSALVKDRPVLLICGTCRGTGTVLALVSGGSLTCTNTTNTLRDTWRPPPSYASVRCSTCSGFGWVLPTWPSPNYPGYPAAPWWITNHDATWPAPGYPVAPRWLANLAGAHK